MNLLKTIPLAAAGLALGLGVNGQAHAYAYAYGQLFVTKGQVTVLPVDQTDLDQFGTCVGDFSDPCALADNPVPNTSASAALGGSGTSTNGGLNTAVATGTGSMFPGGAPTDNSYTLQGASGTDKYSWADADIPSEQALGVPRVNGDGTPNVTSYIETNQMAEANTTDDTLGTAGSKSQSNTVVEMYVSVSSDGGRIRVDFDLAEELFAEITAPNQGVQASASSKFTVAINQCDASGDNCNTNFMSWDAGNDASATGVAVASNGFSSFDVGKTTPGSSSTGALTGSFYVVSDNMAAGVYQLILTSNVDVAVQADVPAPATLLLLSSGMLGLGFARSKKRRA